MASHALASMLDELMGRDRNLAPSEKRNEPRWDDPEVCKFFLCSFCPHELFTNTRADLGHCDKLHDEALRKEYQKSPRFERCGYEEDFLRMLQGLINDVEKRIRRGHQRLALNSTQGSLNGNPASAKEEKIKMLTERISELVEQAEELGCEGKVEEAQGVLKLCDQLTEERSQLENSTTPDPFSEPLKAMEVCSVCGALLVVGDAQQRVDEHIMGKQHSGYARIRAYVEGKKTKLKEADEEREARLIREREEREKEREKEREERRKKEEEKEKEREERRKEREKEREREKEKRRRSRSRSKGRRSSRERKKRSRSRSRHRRRSRSRSRDRHRSSRHHRSRSRERRRSRDRGKRSRSRDKQRSKSKDKDRSERRSSKDRSKSKDKEHRSSDDAEKKTEITMDIVQDEESNPPTENKEEAIKTEGDTK